MSHPGCFVTGSLAYEIIPNQVIQCNQTLSPIWRSRFAFEFGSRKLTIPKRARSQNCQELSSIIPYQVMQAVTKLYPQTYRLVTFSLTQLTGPPKRSPTKTAGFCRCSLSWNPLRPSIYKWLAINWMIFTKSLLIGNGWKSQFPSIKNWLFGVPGIKYSYQMVVKHGDLPW